MTPDVSRACAAVMGIMNVPTGSRIYREIVRAGNQANSMEELPDWMLNLLKSIQGPTLGL
jgi:hypothetical protein